MVCIKHIMICISQSKVVRNRGLLADMPINCPPRISSRQRLKELFLRFSGSSYLVSAVCHRLQARIDLPKTKIFFSGSFFPLLTESNIDSHESFSFFTSALLGLSWSLDVDTCVYVEALLTELAISALEALLFARPAFRHPIVRFLLRANNCCR